MTLRFEYLDFVSDTYPNKKAFFSPFDTASFKQIMKYRLVLIAVLAFTSCIREIDYEVETVPPQLVVNSIVQANHLIEVNVSNLKSIFDTTYQFIDNAEVCIHSGNFVDTLTGQGDGNYLSHFKAEEGRAYTLIVKKAGYPQVFATDTVPYISRIIEASEVQTSELDEYGWPIYEYSVTFECDTTTPQLYELMFIEQLILKDEGTYQLSFMPYETEVDPIISQAGINDFSATYFFSSTGIPSSLYTLKMKMQAGTSSGGLFTEPIIQTGKINVNAVVLRTISQAYLDYRVAWEKHNMLMNDSSVIENLILIPLIGPQPEMFSNIENGRGVFVSYCQSYFILDE